MYTDRVLTCRDCSAEFTFTAAEQQFFEEMGFRHPPRRCKECRKQKKAQEAAGGGAPAHSSDGGSRGDRGPRKSNRQMYPATCSECGTQTTVPFEPDPARATFCPDCYRKRKGARPR